MGLFDEIAANADTPERAEELDAAAHARGEHTPDDHDREARGWDAEAARSDAHPDPAGAQIDRKMAAWHRARATAERHQEETHP